MWPGHLWSMDESQTSSAEAIDELIDFVRGYGNEVVEQAYPLCRAKEMLGLTDERTTLIQTHKKLQAIITVAQQGLEAVEDQVRHRSTIDMEAFHEAIDAEDRVFTPLESDGRDIRREMELEKAQTHDFNVEVALSIDANDGASAKVAEALDSTIEDAVRNSEFTSLKEHEVGRGKPSNADVIVSMVLNTPVLDIEERVDGIINYCLAMLDTRFQRLVRRGSMAISR